jgi:hypothetical protein
VLAQPRTPRLTLSGADPQLLLGARHRGVGLVAADVVDHDPALAAGRHVAVGAALGQTAVGARLAGVEAVVGVERRLVLLGELAVGLHLRGVLDLRLLERDPDLVVVRARVGDRHERGLRTEHAGMDERPLGLLGLLVEVDLLDLADLVST